MSMICPVCRETYAGWADRCSNCGVALVLEGDHVDPRTLPEEHQVIYELGEWSIDQRTDLGEMLAENEIAHAWNDHELVIADHDEAVVDALVAQLDPDADANATEVTYELEEWTTTQRTALESQLKEAGVAYRWEPGFTLVVAADDEVKADAVMDTIAPPDEVDDRPEARSAVLDDLFMAADELARDGRSGNGLRQLTSVIDEVDSCSAPFGLDPNLWEEIADSADAVADALLSESSDSVDIEMHASALRDLLRPLV
jgi:hypothetical protein